MSNIYPTLLIPDYSEIVTFGNFKTIFSFNEVGEETRRNFNDSADETVIQLTYNYLKSTDVSVFLNFYQNMRGGFESFSLPGEVLIHGSSYQGALTDLSTINQWRFYEPPTVVTVFQNIFTVTVKLISTVNTIFDPLDDISGYIQAGRINLSVPIVNVVRSVNNPIIPALFNMSIVEPIAGDNTVVGTVSLAIYGLIIPTTPSALPSPSDLSLQLPQVSRGELTGYIQNMALNLPSVDAAPWGLGVGAAPNLGYSFVTYTPNEPFFAQVNPVSLTGALPTLTQFHTQPLTPHNFDISTNPPYYFQVYISGGSSESVLFVNTPAETSHPVAHLNYRNSLVANPVSPPFMETSSFMYFYATTPTPQAFFKRDFVRQVTTPTGVTQFVNSARGFIINAIPPVLRGYLGAEASIIKEVNSLCFYDLTPDFDDVRYVTPPLESAITLANTPYRNTVQPEPFIVIKHQEYREEKIDNPSSPTFITPIL